MEGRQRKGLPIPIQPFTEEPLRLLDEQGNPVVAFDPEEHLGLAPSRLVQLYEDMVLTREVDRMCWLLQRSGKAAFHISITGHEGAIVGSFYALRAEDWINGYYRTPPAMHVRGLSLAEIFAQLMGTALDPLKGRQMPGHLGAKKAQAFTYGSGVGLAHVVGMGMARALQYRNTGGVVVTYGGEGSTSEPHFHSALNFAGVYRLPLVVMIVNNQYAISVPRAQQTAAKSIAEKGKAYGVPGFYLDGNDPLIVYYVMRQAADRARSGGGPALIEALTYRLDPHSSADDDRKYRSEEEVKHWWERDTLKRMRHFLEQQGLWDDEKEEALRERVKLDVERAVEEAEAAGLPSVEELFQEVYAERPWHLTRQWEELQAEMGEQEGGH